MTERATHAPEPDDALRAGFHAGDSEAATALVDLLHHDVWRFARSLVGSDDSAAEVVQETFLRLLELHRSYDPGRPLRPWVFGVCRTCMREFARRENRATARIVDMTGADGDAVEHVADERIGALELLLRSEREAQAMALLEELPPAAREIVLLHLFEGLTFREIAAVLERPAPTIATTYYRALERLRSRHDQGAPRRAKGDAT